MWLPLGLILMLPVSKQLRLGESVPARLAAMVGYWILLALCIMFILSSSCNPFIDFRF